jgi:hypothetical protein
MTFINGVAGFSQIGFVKPDRENAFLFRAESSDYENKLIHPDLCLIWAK